jgi:hypothetical protein
MLSLDGLLVRVSWFGKHLGIRDLGALDFISKEFLGGVRPVWNFLSSTVALR